MPVKFSIIGAIGTCLCLSVWFAPAFAIDDDETALQAAYEAVLEDPTDIGRTMAYARLATEVGDFEAAIGALERILLLSPEQHKVRANLGLLYHRLESYAASQHHLERALASGKLPADLAERAEMVMDEGRKSMSRHRIDGRISFGFRYRDNANAGPHSSAVLARGFTVALDEEFQEQGDGDFFVLANAIHRYDLQRQYRAVIETDGRFYANRQFDLDDIDNITAELRSGPRFWLLPDDGPELSLRPHVVLNVIARGDDLFSNVYGAGFDLRYRPAARIVTGGTFQHRQRDYHESDKRRLVDERDGHENVATIYARYAITPRISVLGRGDVIDRHAKAGYLDAVEVGVLGRIDVSYLAPFGLGARTGAAYSGSWRAYLAAGYRNLDFDQPNPRVDPAVSRDDDQWRVSIGNAIPVARRWLVNLEASYSDVDSNIANFERDNLSVAVSATWRF